MTVASTTGVNVKQAVQTRQRPFVGNRLWVVPLSDPDGYRIDCGSPTDAPEESELGE